MKHLFTFFLILFCSTAFAQDSLTRAGSLVNINSARVITSQPDNDKHIEINFTNVSKQKIRNIKFRWLETDATAKSGNPAVQTVTSLLFTSRVCRSKRVQPSWMK